MTNLKLFENCCITIGVSRSLIVDMQRQMTYFIPNSLASLFNEQHVFDISNIDVEENSGIVKEYIDFLLVNELCFICDETLIKNFPIIKIEEWDYAAKITNVIVEVFIENFNNYLPILQELTQKYLTRHIEVCLIGFVDIECLKSILQNLNKLDLYSYNIIFENKKTNHIEDVIYILKQNHKLFRSIVHTTSKNQIVDSNKGGWGNIFITKEVFNYSTCGIVEKEYFTTNIQHVTESQNHNTCLNRKLTIDANGDIRNCPNTKESFGNIKDTTLEEAMKKSGFQKYWTISKDEITICKDCEFRHICTDCRAFIEDPEDIYSKPLKCGYNPYTCEWEDWSTNPLKQKAIAFYGMKELVSGKGNKV